MAAMARVSSVSDSPASCLLYITVVEAQLCRIFDSIKSSQDIFVQLVCGYDDGSEKVVGRTETCKRGDLNPRWQEQFRTARGKGRSLKFRVFVDHLWRSATLCGEAEFGLDDLWARARGGSGKVPVALYKKGEQSGVLHISLEMVQQSQDGLLLAGPAGAAAGCGGQGRPTQNRFGGPVVGGGYGGSDTTPASRPPQSSLPSANTGRRPTYLPQDYSTGRGEGGRGEDCQVPNQGAVTQHGGRLGPAAEDERFGFGGPAPPMGGHRASGPAPPAFPLTMEQGSGPAPQTYAPTIEQGGAAMPMPASGHPVPTVTPVPTSGVSSMLSTDTGSVYATGASGQWWNSFIDRG
eukprot:TRINITY_DN7099_c0_g1_i1.p1 TRINITY_DN7099_c0_g1~~TRINITY_DN7099_c0_g1_i1.p1  ORF type:complete len:349 (+),score=45.29 TRINITY_DN7099_c0_g1_i1:95-1141(+)